MNGQRRLPLFFILSLTLFIGCRRTPARVEVPSLDPSAVGKAALAQYDANGDGAIAGPELDKSPALKAMALAKIGVGDKKITADEIAARVKAWLASRAGLISLSCRVILDDAPLGGATVTLVPEKFLGEAIKPASGTTDQQGFAILTVSDKSLTGKRLSGVQVGLYRVEISRKQGERESIPARYNVNSELGQEVAVDVPAAMQSLKFDLRSR
jgi:hypothetical protein